MSQTSSSFIPQFLSKNIWSILGMTALFHVVAGMVLHSVMSGVVLGLVGVVVALLTWKRLELGLCIALFEIVIGAHGHLVDVSLLGFPLSLRMVIFLAVMGAWFVGLLQKRWSVRFVFGRDVPYLALALAVVYGVVRGLLEHQGMGALLDDANSYVTLAYLLPLASVVWTQENRRMFLTTLFAGTLWVSLFTLALTYIFTHIDQEHIWAMYVLVRDTRMFEITLLSSPLWLAHSLVGGHWYFRVFSQAQIFAPLFLLILFSAIFLLRLGKKERVPFWMWVWCASFFGTFLQSLSRSFLVGFFAAGCVMAGFWMMGGREAWRTWAVAAQRKLALGGTILVSAVVLWSLVSFPFPARPDLSKSPFYRGDQDDTRALAISSRWNMLDPMLDALAEHPVLGDGFGKELTYVSDDPRIREMTGGTGELTTYRFEWGFLDIWMKMGVFGLVVYAWILGALLVQVLRNVRSGGVWSFSSVREHWLEIGMVSGAVMLFVVHIFTPYLNHPIGIFYMLLVAFLISWKKISHEKKEIGTHDERVRLFGTALSLGTPRIKAKPLEQ